MNEIAAELIKECNEAVTTAREGFAHPILVEIAASKGRLLLLKLGAFAKIWAEVFEPPKGGTTYTVSSGASPIVKGGIPASRAERMLGAARSIKEAIDKGRLVTIEDEVTSEVLGDLMDQASALFKGGYCLACCVVLRAVLEERLRKLCQNRGCNPTQPRPGIDDYNQALYARGKTLPSTDYQKTDMIWVQSIASIGNDAAHNKRLIANEDAERMTRDVVSFLAKFSI